MDRIRRLRLAARVAALLACSSSAGAVVAFSVTGVSPDFAIEVTANGSGDTVVIARSGDTITVNGANAADRNQTASVSITSSAASGTVIVVVDERNGPFRKGATAIPIAATGGAANEQFQIIPATGAAPTSSVSLVGGGGFNVLSLSTRALSGTVSLLRLGATLSSLSGFTAGASIGLTEIHQVSLDDFNVGNAISATDLTGGSSVYSVAPTAPDDVALNVGFQFLISNSTGGLTVAGGGQGGDTLQWFGTTSPDSVLVQDGSVSATGLKTVNFGGFPSVSVFGGDEAGTTGDEIEIAAGSALSYTLDGGAPAMPAVPGDTLIHNDVATSNSNFETFLVPVGVSGFEID